MNSELSYYLKNKRAKINRMRLQRIALVGGVIFMSLYWFSAMHPTKAESDTKITVEYVGGGFVGKPFTGDEPVKLAPTATPTPIKQAQKPVETNPATIDSIYRHIKAYGGVYTKNTLAVLLKECKTIHNVRVAVAISTPETSQGKGSTFGFNWWGYDRYNRVYQKNQNAVIKAVCIGLSGRYKNIVSDDGKVNVALGKQYNATYSDDWKNLIEWSYKKSGLNYK